MRVSMISWIIKFSSSDNAFRVLWLVHSILVISSYTLVWPYMVNDCGKRCYCLLYTSPSPRDLSTSRMPSSAWKKLDEDAMLCNTMWSDRRRLITKKTFLAFSRTFKRRHWSKLSTEKYYFFLALFRENFQFPAKTFLAKQRLAQSFTI